MTRLDSANRVRLKDIVRQLGSLADPVVFIGGVVAELLQIVPVLPRARPTVDVDGIVGVSSRSDYFRLSEELRKKGFREDIRVEAHAHRWIAPNEEILDLIPLGHQIGTGNRWDELALESPQIADLDDGITIKHVNAPIFLAMKWNAFKDRGDEDWMASRDFEDMVAVVASRPSIADEVRNAVPEVREYLVQACQTIISTEDIEGFVFGALSSSAVADESSRAVSKRFADIGRLRIT